MNTVQLIGRLTDNPTADTTPTGKSVCRMRLAVPGFNRDATPVFIDVENTSGEADLLKVLEHLKIDRTAQPTEITAVGVRTLL